MSEGFTYNDSSESDDSSEHSSSSRGNGRPLRLPLSFNRGRESSAPPPVHREHPRTPLFNLISSRPHGEHPAASAHAEADAKRPAAEESHHEPAPAEAIAPIFAREIAAHPGVPPEAWLPNRALVLNGEAETTAETDDAEDDTEEADGAASTEAATELGASAPAEPAPMRAEAAQEMWEAAAVDNDAPALAEVEIPHAPAPHEMPLASPANVPHAEFVPPVVAPPEYVPLAPPAGVLETGHGGVLPPQPPEAYRAAMGNVPPPPPEYPDSSVSMAAAAWNPALRYNQSTSNAAGYRFDRSQELVTVGEANRDKHYAETRAQRTGVVAGLLTGFLVARYLANKRAKKLAGEVKEEFEARDKHINTLEVGQSTLHHQLAQAEERFKTFTQNQPPAHRFEQAAKAATTTSAAEMAQAHQATAKEMVEQAYEEAQPTHEQRSAWHAVKVDSHGHEVQGAMEYGEEFHHQRRQEQGITSAQHTTSAGPAVNSNGNGGGAAAFGGGASGAADQTISGGVNPMLSLPSSQADSNYGTPGQQYVDPQHRLEPSDRPFAAALSSPLLWVGVAILLLAFFVAAFL